ncbi:MAG: ADP-forming succinate--CoA ligase subunit beta [Dehalococcoidia bacterium]|nr:ADP-forming succinate--CoA ligase subunit beta [Dehalococcoidia bacterium]
MKIHEFQAKQLFQQFNVPVPRGQVAATAEEAKKIAQDLGGKVVVKAQIHAGGRGKGGGVKLANSPDEAAKVASQIIGMQLITHQTGPQGQKVQRVLIEEQMPIERELYFAILLDNAIGMPILMASAEGGMDIEAVAANTPEKIIRIPVDPATGYQPYQGRQIAFGLGLRGDLLRSAVQLFGALYDLYVSKDCSLVEVNPLVVTTDGRLLPLDAKVTFDDNADFRHKDLVELRDKDEEDPLEVQAHEMGILNYIKLDGNIGCVVNGAGLAMATMDSIKLAGGEPANFLDIGTVNDSERVVNALKIITADPAVKVVLFNIFGGMARVDVIAQGIIDAQKQFNIDVPVVARLAGTNVDEGEALLAAAKVNVIRAKDLGEAAKLAVQAAK